MATAKRATLPATQATTTRIRDYPLTATCPLDDESFAVSGDVWLDREWSTSALAVGQVGWDWFAIQLDDGREIMFYQLRTDDGEIDPHSAGVLVRGDGTSLILGSTDVFTEALEHWSPPDARGRYPVRWRMDIERLGLSVEIAAALHEQEHTHSVRYWRGRCRCARPRSGRGK